MKMNWSTLLDSETHVERTKEPSEFKKYSISEYERDYKSIMSSSAFRRLQDKTQVFPLDKSDFVRTRLTHSLEVSSIARQLGLMTIQNDYFIEKDNKKINDIPIILSCAGLLHDIGNPPFGHFGEVVIGEWFRKYFDDDLFIFKGKKIRDIFSQNMKNDLINFEGNAQALRILSKVDNFHEGCDLNLSYSILNTLIKYPTSSVKFCKDDVDIKKHKLGYYCSEKSIIKKICEKTGTYDFDRDEFYRHPLVYLLEASDDIAYSTADIEDALKKGLFGLDEFIEFFEREAQNLDKTKRSIELIDELKSYRNKKYSEKNMENDLICFQKWMDYVRNWLMYVSVFSFTKNQEQILLGEYKDDLFKNTFHEYTIKILKKAMVEFVFNDTEILKLELSARKIIHSLLDDFIRAVINYDCNVELSKSDKKLINLLSENYIRDYFEASKDKTEEEKLYLRFLMVTDYISGMTDSYAKNLYKELNAF